MNKDKRKSSKVNEDWKKQESKGRNEINAGMEWVNGENGLEERKKKEKLSNKRRHDARERKKRRSRGIKKKQ